MKRTFQCAFAAAALLASSSAWAQNFGEKGQLAVSAERLFGFTYDSATQSTGNADVTYKTTSLSLLSSAVSGPGLWGGYNSPRVAGDYFVIDHLSVGGALGYSHWSTSVPGAGNTESTVTGDSFTFAPRVGYLFPLSGIIGIWPRGGFTYRTFSADQLSAHDFALTLEAPFTFNAFDHVVFWAGPTLDVGLTGSYSTQALPNGPKQSFDFNATEFGLQTGMLVYFGL